MIKQDVVIDVTVREKPLSGEQIRELVARITYWMNVSMYRDSVGRDVPRCLMLD